MTTLHTKTRSPRKDTDTLRDGGMVPAVFYGFKQSATPIAVKLSEFTRIWREAGETTAITLKTDDGDIDAIIHDIQLHPVTSVPIHVDFLAIDKNKAIELDIPLEFTNTAPVEKNGEGRIVKVIHEITISAKPDAIPHELEVDLSVLQTLEDQIVIGDISLAEGVELISDPEDVIVAVTEVREEEPEEEPEEIDFESIEVEQKGKDEDEEAGDADEEAETTDE